MFTLRQFRVAACLLALSACPVALSACNERKGGEAAAPAAEANAAAGQAGIAASQAAIAAGEASRAAGAAAHAAGHAIQAGAAAGAEAAVAGAHAAAAGAQAAGVHVAAAGAEAAAAGAEASAKAAGALACVGGKGPGCGGGDHDPAPVAGAIPAAPGAPLQLAGTVYGAGVTVPEVTPVSRILADADAFAGKRVRVEGTVVDVCEMRGCWMNLASDKEFQTIKFKVTDGVIVIPTAARGKYAVAEGVVRKMPMSLEQTRKVLAHEAEEQGKPFDASKVTEAMTMVRLDGLGAVIRDKK